MESKKTTRFEKGSDAAKQYMSELRAKRKGNKGGGNTPPPPPPSPNCDCVPTTEKPKRRNNKNIVVDF